MPLTFDKERLLVCARCKLCETRKQVVYGRGDPCATLQLVGEAPGRDEDETGEAFVGRAGRDLDMKLWAAKINVEECFIHNTVKCRPPDNRDPLPEEFEACTRWLTAHLGIHPPLVVVAMGRFSIGYFRGYSWKEIRAMKVTKEAIRKPFRRKSDGIVVVPTCHPAYGLRNPAYGKTFIASLRRAKHLHEQCLQQTQNVD